MKQISPYIFQAYITCPREAWLEYHSISSNQDHEYLMLGRLIHEDSYKRERKEILIDGNVVIDMFKDELVAEVKKTSRNIEAARLQLIYYLYYLKKEKGVELNGILLFPKERKREKVYLTAELEKKIEKLEEEIRNVVLLETPPKARRIKYCKRCAYNEFCWAEDEEVE